MEQVIKLVRTYQVTTGIAERLHLAEELFRLIEPDLRFFVFAAIRPPAAEDVVQEVLKGVATGLRRFTGDSKEQSGHGATASPETSSTSTSVWDPSDGNSP